VKREEFFSGKQGPKKARFWDDNFTIHSLRVHFKSHKLAVEMLKPPIQPRDIAKSKTTAKTSFHLTISPSLSLHLSSNLKSLLTQQDVKLDFLFLSTLNSLCYADRSQSAINQLAKFLDCIGPSPLKNYFII
jgi:hypothetical protein